MAAGFRAGGQLGLRSSFHMKPCLKTVTEYKGEKGWLKKSLAEIMGWGWGVVESAGAQG